MDVHTDLNPIDFLETLTPQRLVSFVFKYEERYNIIRSNQAILNVCYLLNGYSLYLFGVPLVHNYFEKTQYGPTHPIMEKQISEGVSYNNAVDYAANKYLRIIFALLDDLFKYSNVELQKLVNDDQPIGHRYTNMEMLEQFVKTFGLKMSGKKVIQRVSAIDEVDPSADKDQLKQEEIATNTNAGTSNSDSSSDSGSGGDTGSGSNSNNSGSTNGSGNGDSSGNNSNAGDTNGNGDSDGSDDSGEGSNDDSDGSGDSDSSGDSDGSSDDGGRSLDDDATDSDATGDDGSGATGDSGSSDGTSGSNASGGTGDTTGDANAAGSGEDANGDGIPDWMEDWLD